MTKRGWTIHENNEPVKLPSGDCITTKVLARRMRCSQEAVLLVSVVLMGTRTSSANAGLSSIVSPFGHNHTFAYVFRKRVEPVWKQRDKTVRLNASSGPGFRSAVRDFGMSWNSLGVGFPREWDFSGSLMRHVLEPYFLYTGIRDQPSLQRVVVAMDHRANKPPATPATRNSLFQSLSRNGYALVDQWGIDIDALAFEAETALAGNHKVVRRGAAIVYNGALRSIAPVLQNSTLRAAAAAYLGSDTEITGYEVLRLTDGLATESQYISGYWHHDRCGHRLKAFVFLHDVSRDGGRPTEVVKGSQNTLYYSYHDNWEARFEDKYVQANYETAAMVGPKGGGFIFDTNAIHRGVVNGTQSRTVVILELNRAKKSAELRARGQRAIPCPSGSYFKVRIPCS